MRSSDRFHFGQQLLAQRKISESLAAFFEAEKAGYDADLCAAGRWTCWMLAGEFELAWQESDAISRRGKPDENRFWDGRDVTGKCVLIRCLHGLGDTLQFIRYAPLLRARGCRVIIEAQPAVKELLRASGLADHVMTWKEPEPEYDQQIEVVELPRVFRTTIDSIPARVPYIGVVDGGGTRRPAQARAPVPHSPPPLREGEFRVGLVWCSSRYDPSRSIPLASMAQLCPVPNVAFYSLQADPEREELLRCPAGICDAFHPSGSLVEAARTVQAMDVLITADTMMAHLAGALGRPVWTLLPYRADWRWMMDRDDSPWYPTMRLFRQNAPGDWDGVMERVRVALEQAAQAVAEVAGEGAVRGSAAPGRVK